MGGGKGRGVGWAGLTWFFINVGALVVETPLSSPSRSGTKLFRQRVSRVIFSQDLER